MADISKIKVGNTTYNIKDTTARTSLTQGNYGDNDNQNPSYGDTFKVPSISVGANGQITSIDEHTVKIPISDNTDSNVEQVKGNQSNFPVLLAYNNTNNVDNETTKVRKSSYLENPDETMYHIYANPGNGRLTANGFHVKPKFTILSEQPSDWSTNYTDYYVISDNIYTHITGDAAPVFVANTYYKRNAYINGIISQDLSNNRTQTLPNVSGTLLNSATTSFTPTITKDSTQAYKIGTIKINNIETEIYGRDSKTYELYGVKIDKNNSDPETRVQYIYDAVGLTPARMNFQTGQFDYGSWKNAWFILENKPCALKYDGTVDYYINSGDYSKKTTGFASDINDINYAGNFMASLPLIYIRRWEDENYYYIAFCNKKINSQYHAYAYAREDYSISDTIYLPMFKGSIINNKLRSLYGQIPSSQTSVADEISAAEACGSGWQLWDWSKYQLISDLLILISCSTNTQAAFGQGVVSTNELIYTGQPTIEYGGAFYGTNDGTHHVRVFHIEDFWGNRADTCLGLNSVNKYFVYKLSKPYSILPDNSYTTTTFILPTSGYQSQYNIGAYGRLPNATEGSSSTYFCDTHTLPTSNDGRNAIIGGYCTKGAECGANYLNFRIPNHTQYTVMGASPVYNAPYIS